MEDLGSRTPIPEESEPASATSKQNGRTSDQACPAGSSNCLQTLANVTSLVSCNWTGFWKHHSPTVVQGSRFTIKASYWLLCRGYKPSLWLCKPSAPCFQVHQGSQSTCLTPSPIFCYPTNSMEIPAASRGSLVSAASPFIPASEPTHQMWPRWGWSSAFWTATPWLGLPHSWSWQTSSLTNWKTLSRPWPRFSVTCLGSIK